MLTMGQSSHGSGEISLEIKEIFVSSLQPAKKKNNDIKTQTFLKIIVLFICIKVGRFILNVIKGIVFNKKFIVMRLKKIPLIF